MNKLPVEKNGNY